MSIDAQRASLFSSKELAILLTGCGISGLPVPSAMQNCSVGYAEATNTLVCLYRDGLLLENSGKLLDYRSDLRSILVALRDSPASIVVQLSDDALNPIFLHLGADGTQVVLMQEDNLRTGSIRLLKGPAASICDELVEHICMVPALPLESRNVPNENDWQAAQSMSNGVLCRVLYYRRHEDAPHTMLVCVRTQMDGDFLFLPGQWNARTKLSSAALLAVASKEGR